jgi:hypothetical protein
VFYGFFEVAREWISVDSLTRRRSLGADGGSDRPAVRLIFLLYCFVLGITFTYISYRFAFQPAGSEFLGLYLGAVTLPWSLVVMPVLAIASPDLPWFNVLALLACGVLNLYLIRQAGRRTDQRGAR